MAERTFVFVDVSGFSALTEAHGDEASADLVARFVALAEQARAGDATLVAVLGDAVFLAAADPGSALRVLTRLLDLADREPRFPVLRAGLHHGAAVRRGGQFYGAAVNVAARVAAHARGGQVLGTAAVAAAAREAGWSVRALGPIAFKNLRAPLAVYELARAEDTAAVVDPVCRMRLAPGDAEAELELDGVRHWFCSRACLRAFVERGR